MNPLALLKDILQQNTFIKSLSTTNARIQFTAADVTGAVVKQLPISLVTIESVRPKCFFIEPELGVQLLVGFSDVTQTELNNQFSLQVGEFVNQNFGFIIPPETEIIYFLMLSLPNAEATTGIVNVAFHGGW